MTGSTLRWLDHDAEQARRSAELVKALSEPDTVDSLGIGTIRDGFANVFFPGTSTIQTRAQYFLLAPWALQLVQQRRPRDRAQYDQYLEDVETETIDALLARNPDELGIIGRQRRRATKRKAVSVYWTGLGEWGIRVDRDMTMSSHRAYVLAHRRGDDAEDDSGQRLPFQVWDETPPLPDGFPAEPLSIIPSADEADYLLNRMAGTHAGGGSGPPGQFPSLLAAVAANPHTADAHWLWDLSPGVVPDLLSEAVHHARMFSLVVQGARLLYVRLLFERQLIAGFGESPGRDDVDARLDAWIGAMQRDAQAVAAWVMSLDDVFILLGSYQIPISETTRSFVRAWCNSAGRDPRAALRSTQSAALLEARERTLKGPNARLAGGAALQAWDGSFFGAAPLDYRWGTARRMVLDCRQGLEAGDAVA